MYISNRVVVTASYVFLFFALGFGTQITFAGSPAAAPSAAPIFAPQQSEKVVLPDGEGKAIVETSCQECHELTNVTNARKSLDDWRETVETMRERGANVSKDKVEILVKYLATNWGPLPPPRTPQTTANVPADASTSTPQKKIVELPEGDGKSIATAACQVCHKLTNLTNAHKSVDDWRDTVEVMIDRGAEVPTDKVEVLIQYLAKNFGPKAPPAGTGAPSESAPKAH